MQTVTVKRNSWHYQIAHEYGSATSYNLPATTCDYVRAVFKGLFAIAMFVGLIGGLLGCMATTPLYLYFSYTGGGLGTTVDNTFMGGMPPMLGFIIWATAFISVIIAVIRYVTHKIRLRYPRSDMKLRELHDEVIVPTDQGFLVMAYYSLKKKFCMRIEYK